VSGTANAAVVSGSSSGYGVDVSVSALAGALALDAGPLPSGASGSAPAPYNLDDTQLSLSLSDSVCVSTFLGVCTASVSASVGTGLLSGHADSDVDGGNGVRSAAATGTVNDAAVNLGTGTLLGIISTSVLDLSATTLSASAQVSGDFGAFTPLGSSIIENAFLNVAGIPLIALDADAAPNTVVDPLGALSLLGLTVILNEQVSNCGAASCDMMVNALRLGFNDFAVGTALLNGDLIFGHAEANLLAQPSEIPVPAAAWLFASGLLGLVGMARRRSNA
jgi:hypothetical protein